MKVGETVLTDSVIHRCMLFTDRPGRVQYFSSAIPHQQEGTSQGSRGRKVGDKNLEKFLNFSPTPWLHQYASGFISMGERVDTKIRFV